MRDRLKNLIVALASNAAARQAEAGSMPAGHNGPYGHTETRLRNTGHWLLVWLQAFRLTNDSRFESAASAALDYMLRPEHRPNQANWLQREHVGKDRCNGVIGAAWTIEALLGAHQHFGSAEALEQSVDVWSKHRFDPQLGLWHRLEVDGSIQKIDQTFNHQLWFAASVARLARCEVAGAREQLESFMDRLPRHFTLHGSAVIRHRIRLKAMDYIFDSGGLPNLMHERYKQIKTGASKPLNPKKRDRGYHAFNLHAFAVIKQVCPEHVFWESGAFREALDFAQSETFIESLEENPYGYAYNPVGFEMAFALKEFVADSETAQYEWIDRQLNFLGANEAVQYGESADDPETACARIYEALELF
jgi:hypothetical protein